MRQFALFFAIYYIIHLPWTANAVPLKRFLPRLNLDAVETFELDENNLPRRPLLGISQQNAKVENVDDIIQLLLPHCSSNYVVEGLVKVFEAPEVRFLVDRVLFQFPELPRLLISIGEFFKGAEAKPLIDAFSESVEPVMKTLLVLYEKIKGPVEIAIEELMVEGIRLFFRLQNPDIVQVLKKLQTLPEIHELAGYLIVYNIDLVRDLQRLENLLNGSGLRL